MTCRWLSKGNRGEGAARGRHKIKKSDNRLQKFKERGYPLNGVPRSGRRKDFVGSGGRTSKWPRVSRRKANPFGPSIYILAGGEWRSHAVPTVSSYKERRETKRKSKKHTLWHYASEGEYESIHPAIIRSPKRFFLALSPALIQSSSLLS